MLHALVTVVQEVAADGATQGIGLIGAGLAIGGAALGAGLGIGPIGSAAASGIAKMTANIVASEPHGAHSVLHLDVNGTTIRARHTGFFDADVGERIDMALEQHQLHWFDAISGQRIDDEG